MKKRLLTILLSIAMILMLTPMTAMAATGDVAQVGEAGYETLQSAINNSNGEIVTLLQDTEEDIVVSSGSVTLDLNGKTLTANTKDAIEVKIGAELTVVDNAGGGKVMANKSGYAAVLNSGKVTLSGGTYGRASAGTWYTIVNHGELMTINGGVTVENSNTADTSSLVENGYYSYSGSNSRNSYVDKSNYSAPKLIINGGNFDTAGYNAVKNDEGGVLQINGGNYTSQRASGAVIMNWNEAEITGGTFISTKENTAVFSNGTWGNYAKGTVEISGGDFIVDKDAKNAVLFGYGQGAGEGGTMNVTGGYFDGDFELKQTYEVNIENCTATQQVPVEFLASEAGQLKLTSGSAGGYYVGTSEQLNKAVAAAEGLTEINVLSGDMDLVDVPTGIKVTNNGDGKVTVNGSELKTDESVVWYYVDANGGVPSEGNYKPGDTVNIKAAEAKEGEHFAGWTVVEGGITLKDATSEEISFTMPSANVVLTANFEAHTYKDGVCTVCGAADPDYEEFVPEIIKGANATWQKGDEGLSFTSNAEFADFIKVQVDGKDLNAANYTVKEGSTIVTLKASYLDTLEAGDHTLAIVSKTGTAETKFTVAKDAASDTPKTDDSANMMMWLALMMLAGAGAVGTKVYSRKFK